MEIVRKREKQWQIERIVENSGNSRILPGQ
jgi:hypothetical protein